MKFKSFTSIATMFVLTGALAVSAGPGRGKGKGPHGCGHGKGPHGIMSIENLTDDQRRQIQEIHLGFKKELIPQHSKIKMLETEIQELLLKEANLTQVDDKIDEISKIRADIMKKKIRKHQKVAALLTDEQKQNFKMKAPMWHHDCRGGCKHGGNCPRAGKGKGRQPQTN
ncbi:MAG: periplasmic heavy metal sensor [Chitinivibrionales bacterium]|nr:periplasmic heavy metal sensor [Chitinivibrionales bacterium]